MPTPVESIPSHCFEEVGHVSERLVCEQRGRKITFLKPRGQIVDKINVDGCAMAQRTARDYLVVDWLGGKHFMELKGSGVERAFIQIEQTILHFLGRASQEAA